MAIQKSKDVQINGITFRVGLLSALVGDWLITQLLTKRFTDAEVYRKSQDHLLGVCSVYVEKEEARVPMRIYDNGRWLVAAQYPDLEYDVDTVHQLCQEALDFNIGPFFEKLKARASALEQTSATLQ